LTLLRDQANSFDDLLQQIVQLEERNSQLEGDLLTARLKEEGASAEAGKSAALLSAASEQIHGLEQRLSQAVESAEKAKVRAADLEVRLTSVQEQESGSRRQLQAQEDRALKDRTELQQRVQMNAERRLDEYRNALASSLARLLFGLPRRGSSISEKDGGVILVRLYEVVDYLRSKGIQIQNGQGNGQ
jgi:chromosome segregation ATPase